MQSPGDTSQDEGNSSCKQATSIPAQQVAEILEVLSITPWSTDSQDTLKDALHSVYSKFGLDLPTSRSNVGTNKPVPVQKPASNQYADLVRENHY